jgi:hypothetical protein
MELVATSASDLQAMVSIFHVIAQDFGQLISASKSKVMVIEKEASQTRVEILVGNQVQEVVEEFRHLGSFEHEILSRRQKMNASYYRFKHVLHDKNIAEGIRLALYNAVVVPNALYGCQVWNVTAAEIHKLFTADIVSPKRNFSGEDSVSSASVLIVDSTVRMPNTANATALLWSYCEEGGTG